MRAQRLPLIHRGVSANFEWVSLQLPEGSVLRIPIEWTDLSVPDPYLLTGRGRAAFRVPDLLELRPLLDSLLAEIRR